MNVTIDISVGELADRASILAVKRVMIKDDYKQTIILAELMKLNSLIEPFVCETPHGREVGHRLKDLYNVNLQIWKLINEQRSIIHDKKLSDDNIKEKFNSASMDVIRLNDERFYLKQKIDRLVRSSITEVKEIG